MCRTDRYPWSRVGINDLHLEAENLSAYNLLVASVSRANVPGDQVFNKRRA
jgi:hypothetical protein